MAQTKNERRVAPTEARAKQVNMRISPQKLNLVAASIRGMPVQKALNELEFSRKRIAGDVMPSFKWRHTTWVDELGIRTFTLPRKRRDNTSRKA